MNNTTFGFSQANDGTTQLARVTVPGCGRNEKNDAPVILVEVEGDKVTLLVFGDIQSKEPTHEISLNGAKIGRKTVIARTQALDPIVQASNG